MRKLSDISILHHILITLICTILLIDTNFSSFLKTTPHVTCENDIEEFISTIAECMQHSDYGNSNNIADSGSNTTSGTPLEEENRSSEEELIPHAFEKYFTEIIHVKINSVKFEDISHIEPHIEFLTPPPEI